MLLSGSAAALTCPVPASAVQNVRCNGIYAYYGNPPGTNDCPTGHNNFHDGIDISVPRGTPIYAVDNGVILFAGTDPSGVSQNYGNYVVMQANGGLVHFFGHMLNVATTTGANVKAGTIIGYADSTGFSTGDHLHWGIHTKIDSPNDPHGIFINQDAYTTNPAPYWNQCFNGSGGGTQPPPATTGNPYSCPSRPNLQQGASGVCVQAVQWQLRNVYTYSNIAVDGQFGPLTGGAVSDFQSKHGIPASGVVDGNTWNALYQTSSGSPSPSSSGPTSNPKGQVFRLYRAILNRDPDQGGYNFWVSQDTTASSVYDIANKFLTTPEGQQKNASLSDAQFVTALYNDALGRAPESTAAVNFWAGQIPSKGRNGVVVGISESAEAQKFWAKPVSCYNTTPGGSAYQTCPDGQVFRLYRAVLNRTPGLSEISYWVGQDTNGLSIYNIANGFLTSPEGQKDVGSLSDAQFVAYLYANGLGRTSAPSQNETNFWVGQIASQGRNGVVVGISESAEAYGHWSSQMMCAIEGSMCRQ